jgi:hypothetical protein
MDFPKCQRCGMPFHLVPFFYTWTWAPTCLCNQPVNIATTYSTTTEGAVSPR